MTISEFIKKWSKAQPTETNLSNDRPTWLDLAHRRLDEARCVAYGWEPDVNVEAILAGLLELNRQREPS